MQANKHTCYLYAVFLWIQPHTTSCMKYSVIFFNMCSFPFRTCRSAKNVGGRDGETGRRGRRSQWGQRQTEQQERTSKRARNWLGYTEREEWERKPSWLCSKLLPLATAPAPLVFHWPADSMHHNPMHDSSANRGFPCNSAFWISFSPWQHNPVFGPGCGLCGVHKL